MYSFVIFQHTNGVCILFQYGYKSKDLRHPVRKIGEENNENEVEQKDEKKEEKKYKQPDFVKKNRGKFHKTKESKSDQNIADKGTVTLTQEQLNAILESVGKLATGTDKSLRINIGNRQFLCSPNFLILII